MPNHFFRIGKKEFKMKEIAIGHVMWHYFYFLLLNILASELDDVRFA